MALVLAAMAPGAGAQVALDGSTGPAGPVGSGPVPGFGTTDHLVSGDLGQRSGDTLLHGFSQFSIGTGRSATFTPGSHTGVARVIARVSGGAASQIQGTLRSTVPGADVFLLNPAGVIFGAGSRIDVPAALHVSTADVLRFADGSTLELGAATTPVLSISPPEEFGFLRATPASIELASGTLWNGTPGWLSLAAGDVRLRSGASILATGARVDLVATGGPASVRISDPGAASAQAGGTIHFDGGSLVGFGLGARRFTFVGGNVVLDRGARVGSIGALRAPDVDVLTGDLVIAGGSRIDVGSYDANPGGLLRVRASGTVDVAGLPATRTRGGLYAESETGSIARGGTIDLAAEHLLVHDGGILAASVQGLNGSAGAIRVDVGTLVTRDGGSLDVSDRNGARAHAPGTIDVIARERVSIEPGFWAGADLNELDTGLVAAGDLAGGRIVVTAPEIDLSGGVVGSDADGQWIAAGAPVTLRADRIRMHDHGLVRTTSWIAAPAGDVTIEAREWLRFAVRSGFLDNVSIETDGFGSGAAGTIRISGGDVVFDGGGRVSTRSAKARLDLPGGAEAGSILLDVASLDMTGGEMLAGTGGRGGEAAGGRAGSIVVRAREHVALGQPSGDNASRITAESVGDADGGSVTVEAPRVLLRDGARIDARTNGRVLAGSTDERRGGRAGSVTVRADELVLERGARISTATEGGALVSGRGGDVRIEGGRIVVDSRSQIESSSSSLGDAGAVNLSARRLDVRGGGAIETDATSSGAAGRIDVAAGAIEITGRGDAGAASTIASRNAGPSAGGDVVIDATTLAVRDGGEISVASTGTGDAGTLVLRVTDALVVDGGRITTSAPQANGGDVEILAGRLVRLQNAELSADVGDGRGGTITIDPQYVLIDASRLSAQAGSGIGGAIRIVGSTILISPDSVLSASAGPAGIDGTVSIEGPRTDETESLQALPVAFLPATELLRSRCAAQRGARGSLVAATAPRARPGEWGLLSAPSDEPARENEAAHAPIGARAARTPGEARAREEAAGEGEPVALVVARDGARAARILRCGGAS